MNSHEKKRKIKLIDRGFQYRLMLKFIMVNIFIMMLFGALIYIFFQDEIAANLASAHAAYRNTAGMLLPIVIALSLFNIIFSSFFIAIVIVYSSHKIAGPLFRFNNSLRELAGGNLNTITAIRNDDQLQELSDSLATLTNRLNSDFYRLKEVARKLENVSDSWEIENARNELKNMINEYRLAAPPETKPSSENIVTKPPNREQ